MMNSRLDFRWPAGDGDMMSTALNAARRRAVGLVTLVGVGVLMTACSGGGGGPGGDPGARPLPAGYTCQSIRAELNKLDSQGAQSKVEAVNSGRKVDDKTRAVATRYNELLNYYLGGRCHV
jgi:hypothetical protein